MNLIVFWLVTVIAAWVPPGRKIEMFPEAKETKQEALDRYKSIAEDLVAVAFDPEEKPLFRGSDWSARSKTALLLASVALKESGYRKDVDFGLGKMGRGDQGRSVCLLQLNVGTGKVPLPGVPGTWGAEDLLADRKKCFRAGLGMIRRSMSACRGSILKSLAGYTSGSCEKGQQSSENRVRAYLRALERFPVPRPPSAEAS